MALPSFEIPQTSPGILESYREEQVSKVHLGQIGIDDLVPKHLEEIEILEEIANIRIEKILSSITTNQGIYPDPLPKEDYAALSGFERNMVDQIWDAVTEFRKTCTYRRPEVPKILPSLMIKDLPNPKTDDLTMSQIFR